MFVKLTGVAFKGAVEQYYYTIYLNYRHIESIQPSKGVCKVYMVSDPENPYTVTESDDEILAQIPECKCH